jgi:ABC-type multidrug transport system fused ATPase/permease subunit
MKRIWKTMNELFDVLPDGTRRFYAWYSIATGLLAILDTLALALVVFSITAFASGNPISLPVVGDLPEAATVWVLIIVCALFILKGVLAVLLHWVATRKFAQFELEVGNRLFRSFTHSTWESRSKYSTAEITRIVDGSISNANRGFLMPLSLIPGNALTFVSVLIVLIVAQPLAAALAAVYLTLVSLFVFLVVNRRAREQGTRARDYSYKVARVMTEMIEALKEITLRGKLNEVGKYISENRRVATRARANINFLSIVPKYTFESALIGGFLLIGGVTYLVQGPEAAVVSLGLFAATGFRMMPAMNSVQSAFTTASASEIYALDVINQLNKLEAQGKPTSTRQEPTVLPDSPKSLVLEQVSFRYPGTNEKALANVNLEVPFGSRLAIVGPSGAGKSTLIDLLLGLSVPTEGSVQIDGRPLDKIFDQWRTRVGYVPQRVALFDASIAQNIALTWGEEFDESKVISALERAQLTELLDRPGGIHERLGERGGVISGGQQQRMGIARALYTDPLVLILDEATSALDTATESRVTEAMKQLRGEVTFVTIAHRLATIRDYEQICYLENGRVLGQGTFEDLKRQVPAFAVQASLAGLGEGLEA